MYHTSNIKYLLISFPPCLLSQHCLTAFGGIIAIPLILSSGLCLQFDGLTQSHLISTIFFVSGICTLLQVTFGIRLPILQGGTFTLLAPSMAMLSMPEWTCPSWTQNASLVNTSSTDFIELQGSIMVGSLFQVFVGFSGLIGLFMRFIGPLTIAPTIALIGLSLFDSAGTSAGNHWGISTLIILFSQYLRHIPVPFPTYSKEKKLHTSRVYVFQILPVLLGIILSWLICYILTVSNVLPAEPDRYGYLARTDLKGDVVSQAPWFNFPYPGQWGMPTVSLAGVVGILAGVISSMIESVGDYHACARLSGAPPPPKHAINRGIGIEGLGCLLAGAWGTGNGTTSYSENVGALGITKVGSRMVIVASGVLMVAMGVFGKVGAIFTTIPSPVVGGMFMVMFGVISAAGVSNLQYADMNSSRNIFIFGFSMFSGLVIPNWIFKNPTAISTGVAEVDQVLQVLLTTSMFVGEKAIHAFISSRLDYCNALYVGLNQTSISRLQLLQNAAARFLTNTSRRAHSTAVLYTLHWLPVCFRIYFKILLFVFKALNGLAPEYLSEILTLREHNRSLRSSNQLVLEVPRSRYKQWGDQAFAVAAPRLWNKLPPDFRTITDVALFRSKL
uniref:Solute carrier family 23 member 4 n=1 Tax=Sander lucioperca TaxID=283035 RepID=A0A8C9YRA1_SANLU